MTLVVTPSGRWEGIMPPSEGCDKLLTEFKSLPVESRMNIARHLDSFDPLIKAKIEELRKR